MNSTKKIIAIILFIDFLAFIIFKPSAAIYLPIKTGQVYPVTNLTKTVDMLATIIPIYTIICAIVAVILSKLKKDKLLKILCVLTFVPLVLIAIDLKIENYIIDNYELESQWNEIQKTSEEK